LDESIITFIARGKGGRSLRLSKSSHHPQDEKPEIELTPKNKPSPLARNIYLEHTDTVF